MAEGTTVFAEEETCSDLETDRNLSLSRSILEKRNGEQ